MTPFSPIAPAPALRGRRAGARITPTLASAFDPRANSFAALRLGPALLVAVVHASALADVER